MNCRSEALEVTVEARQVEEAMLALLHTILLHRSTGKFHYKKEGTYSIGTVGTQDIDCDFIDFTFVRVSSEELDRAIRRAVSEFKVQTVHDCRLNPCRTCYQQYVVSCFSPLNFRMLWATRAATAWAKFPWNSTKRRSPVGLSQTNAFPGKFGASKLMSSTWPMSRRDRSAGRKSGRSWARR